MKLHFFTLDSTNLVVEEFFHEGYERSSLYIWNKNQNKKNLKLRLLGLLLFGLFQSVYIDKLLKQFSMKEFKRWYLPMSHMIRIFKIMFSQTQIERDMMKIIPYILDIRSIMHVMLYIRSNVSYTLSITNKY
jgi:hypothetical protein